MSEKEYRTALGFIFAGPWEKEVTTGQGVKTVIEYMLSGVGLNGDVVLKLSFWDSAPEFVKSGAAVLVSGAFDTYQGKDKDGNEKLTRTINVNKIVELGENQLSRTTTATKPAARKRVTVPEADIEDDLGF